LGELFYNIVRVRTPRSHIEDAPFGILLRFMR